MSAIAAICIYVYLYKCAVSFSAKNPREPKFAFIAGALLGPFAPLLFPLRKNIITRFLWLYPLMATSLIAIFISLVALHRYITDWV